MSLVIDRDAVMVTVNGEVVDFTPTEFRFLCALVDRVGKVVSRADAIVTVWNGSPDIQTRMVDMTASRIRSKLGEAGDFVKTVRGFGYRLEKEAIMG